MRAVRAVCGCQFAVWLFVCLCFVLNGVRPLLGSPRLGLRFAGRVGGGHRPAPLALCVGSSAPRRVSRARAPCAPALRVRSSAPAPALAARSSCLSAFRWCVPLWRSPRAALRCGDCPLCSCRLLRFRFVCLLCDIPPRALFVRATRAMFAVVSPRLFHAFPRARARFRARSSRSYAPALVPRAFAGSFRFAPLARGASIDG